MNSNPDHFTTSFSIENGSTSHTDNATQDASSLFSNSMSFLLQRYQALTQKTNSISVFFAYFKIFTSMCVLLAEPLTCNKPLPVWLFMVMFSDFMAIIGNILKIQVAKLGAPDNNEDSEAPGVQAEDALYPAINPRSGEHNNEEGSLLCRQGNLKSSQRAQAYDYLLRSIQKYSPWYYAILFMYGYSIVFDLDSDCSIKAPLLNKIAVTFVVLQYITVSLCFFVLCICCSAICWSIAGMQQAQASQDLIEELSTHKYPTDLAGDHECSICLCAYEIGTDVIQFDCSKMHHFHSECIKKWLKVNLACPVCRTTLEDMRKNKNTQEESLEIDKKDK